MEIVVVVVLVALLIAAVGYVAVTKRSEREHERALRREKLDGVVAGHREMADAHVGPLEELRTRAVAHRQAAADHTRQAEELEERIEREERHARFHQDRAAATEQERGQV